MAKPKAKSKSEATKRPAKKPARSPVTRARTAAPKGKQAARPGLDPRVAAAIGLALRDEAVAESRASRLQQELSPWTALGRMRVSRVR